MQNNAQTPLSSYEDRRAQSLLRGQGAIEYLLIIGAAILVVAIVVIAMTSITSTGKTQTQASTLDQNKSLSGLQKLSANELTLNNYTYINWPSYEYLPQYKIKFTRETNCTIKTALLSIAKILPTNTSLYMGGDNSNYCGGTNGIGSQGTINCDQKIQTNTDYNFQISINSLPTPVKWVAWCD